MTDKPEGETNFLAVVKDHKPELVLLDPDARKELYDHIEKEIGEKQFDMATAAGREGCGSFAMKITTTKTALTATALNLTEQWRKNTAEVNKQRKPVEETLAALAAKARKPLTDWEEAEKARLETVESTILALNAAAVVEVGVTATQVEDRLATVRATELTEAVFKGALEAAESSKVRTTEILEAALARLKEQEAQAARLAQLEAEAEERRKADEQKAAEEKAKADAEAARQREEAEKAKVAEIEAQRRKDSAKTILTFIEGSTGPHSANALPGIIRDLERITPSAEAYGDEHEDILAKRDAALTDLRARWDAEQERRQEEAAEAAAAAAKAEAEKAAAEAAAEAQRIADEQLAAEKKRAEDAEAESLRLQIEREAADKKREDDLAAERERREKAERDEAHRTLCKRQAKEALMTVPGIDEKMARDIVILILAHEVPRVALDFAAEVRPVSSREAFDHAREEAPEAEAAEHAGELPLCSN